MHLLYQIVRANMKIQHENSYFGMLWYVLGPMLLFAIMLFVFAHRLGSGIEHYPLYLLTGIITWNVFATGTGRAMTTFTANAGLLKSLPVRPDILVLSTVVHAFVSHCIEVLVLMGMMLWYRVYPAYLPLYGLVLLLHATLTYGIGLTLAQLYVFFRDLQQIWSVVTRAWWFATPIFYAATATGPGRALSLYNPLYYSITLPRELLIYHRMPSLTMFAVFAAFALGSVLCAYALYRYTRSRFPSLL